MKSKILLNKLYILKKLIESLNFLLNIILEVFQKFQKKTQKSQYLVNNK